MIFGETIEIVNYNCFPVGTKVISADESGPPNPFLLISSKSLEDTLSFDKVPIITDRRRGLVLWNLSSWSL